MTLVERIERGMTTMDDAAAVQRLAAALARMLSLAPYEMRRSAEYESAIGALADALEDRRD